MRVFLISIVALIYFFVGGHLNSNVKKASTHGNTKHGWHSKYNQAEKDEAMLWMVGFPLAAFAIYSLFSFLNKPRKPRDNSSHSEIVPRPVSKVTPALPQPPPATPHDYSKPTKPDESLTKKIIPQSSTPPADVKMKCPRCGCQMKLRIALRGRNAGKNFWGCSKYPKCKFTLDCFT